MAGISTSTTTLRRDLRAIHSILGEVLKTACPEVPSWRFPGRLASSLNLEDLLYNNNDEEEAAGDERSIFLEGLIDRLLLLLQTSLKLWSENEDRPSHSLPLTLPSVVKKFSRGLLQNRYRTRDLQKQVKVRDEEVTSLRTALSQREEQCSLLQTALEHARTSSSSSSSSSQCKPGSESTRVVPYVARNTLRVSRLQSSHSDHHPSLTNLQSHSKPSPIGLPLVPLTSTTDDQSRPKCATTATQTAETAFAMCVQCSLTQAALMVTSGKLQELCLSLNLSSRLSETNWEREIEIDSGKWREMVVADLESVKQEFCEKEEEMMRLRECVASCKSQERELNSKLFHISSQLSLLQDSSAEMERNHAGQLASCRELGLAQVRETEKSLRTLQSQRDRLEDQLTRVEREKEMIKASSALIEKQQRSVQTELLEVKERERKLSGCQQRLIEQQKRLENELVQSKDSVQNERLQLNKATALHRTLHAKHQAVLNRQKVVLQRLGEMDQEAEEMRRELVETARTRDQVVCKMEELQTQCTSLQSQVHEYEEKLVVSVGEKEKMREELSGLELQLSSLSAELEKEKESCRLLVTHPETRSTGSGSGRNIQKHISANTIRILLLEEQNSELRETVIQKARDLGARRRSKEMLRPLPLWHNGSVASVLLSQSWVAEDPLTRPPSLPAAPAPSTSPASSLLRAPP